METGHEDPSESPKTGRVEFTSNTDAPPDHNHNVAAPSSLTSNGSRESFEENRAPIDQKAMETETGHQDPETGGVELTSNIEQFENRAPIDQKAMETGHQDPETGRVELTSSTEQFENGAQIDQKLMETGHQDPETGRVGFTSNIEQFENGARIDQKPMETETGHQDPPESPETGRVKSPSREELCPHLQAISLYKLSSKLQSLPPICETCRHSNHHMFIHSKRFAMMQSKPRWICLTCGHFSCGDAGISAFTRSHAHRHANLLRHPLAIHHKNHQLIWCFDCDKTIDADTCDDDTNAVLREVSEILKSSESATRFWERERERSMMIVRSSSIGTYRVRGLLNLGNTCFFNSVMQSLFALTRFRSYISELDEPYGPISDSLMHMLDRINEGSVWRPAIDPSHLFDRICSTAPHFRGYNQHDSHELLRCLLDALSTEETRSRNAGPTFVDGAFGGRLSSSVRCLECGHASTMYESFLDLSLSIPTKKPPPSPPRKVVRIEKVPEEAEKVPEEGQPINMSWLDEEEEDKQSISSMDMSTEEDAKWLITKDQLNDVVSLSHPKIVTFQHNGRLFPETCYISQHFSINTKNTTESESETDSSDSDAFQWEPDPDELSENNSDPTPEATGASTCTTIVVNKVDIINNDDDDDDEDDDGPVCVETCLALFMKPEHLSKEEHAWQCDNCKVKRDATKSLLMDRAPKILTVQLKRFNQDARGYFSKLTDHVEFRETVDLKPYMDSSATNDKGKLEYRLVGVVEHGGNMGRGHYVAYVRCSSNEGSGDSNNPWFHASNKGSGDSNNAWFHVSDAYVREVSLEEVLRSQAYLLFYEAV